MKFNLEMNKVAKSSYTKLEDKFYYISLNLGYLAFNFRSVSDATNFYNLITKPQNNNIIQENINAQNISFSSNSPEFNNVIIDLVNKLSIQYEYITKNDKPKKKIHL